MTVTLNLNDIALIEYISVTSLESLFHIYYINKAGTRTLLKEIPFLNSENLFTEVCNQFPKFKQNYVDARSYHRFISKIHREIKLKEDIDPSNPTKTYIVSEKLFKTSLRNFNNCSNNLPPTILKTHNKEIKELFPLHVLDM